MANDEETPTGEIKIRRTRRRIYEHEAAAPAAAADTERVDLPREQRVALPAHGEKQYEALRLVRQYMLWSAGAGLVPIPFLDMLAVVALQLRMLKRLCALYGLNYAEQRAKSVVTSLIGGIHAGLIAGSMIRLIPIIGLASLAAIPAASGALTYAVGRVFIQHFECGGAFLDFDPAKVRKYFAEQYEEGRTINSAVRSL
ncbi:MAG TPA: DUF697 domain-containing protein [Syntrophales bacterium]|nr:DUF697 domain-containing protein [Syntrophales bacterium]